MKKALVALVALVAAAAAWVYHEQSQPPEIPFVRVQRATLVSPLSTNGKVEPVTYQMVHTEAAGVVASVPVHEGQAVRPGQLLATLRDSTAEADLATAEARIARARAELERISQGGATGQLTEIRSQIARAELDRSTAKDEVDTLERLVARNAATRAELDAARTKLKEIELQIRALQQKQAALVTPSDRGVAQAELRDAEASADAARRRIALTRIQAPLGGTVYRLSVRPGDFINSGDPVAGVGRLDKMLVRVYVDEPELGRVHLNQPVTITWDALPGAEWKGTVSRLPTEIRTFGTRQVGEVECRIANPDGKLVPGTNVNVEIRTSVTPNALIVPKEALRRQGAETGVLVLRDSRLAWQPVKTGAASITDIEISSGLQEGDSVALPSGAPVQAGAEVRPVYP